MLLARPRWAYEEPARNAGGAGRLADALRLPRSARLGDRVNALCSTRRRRAQGGQQRRALRAATGPTTGHPQGRRVARRAATRRRRALGRGGEKRRRAGAPHHRAGALRRAPPSSATARQARREGKGMARAHAAARWRSSRRPQAPSRASSKPTPTEGLGRLVVKWSPPRRPSSKTGRCSGATTPAAPTPATSTLGARRRAIDYYELALEATRATRGRSTATSPTCARPKATGQTHWRATAGCSRKCRKSAPGHAGCHTRGALRGQAQAQ